MDKLNVLFEDNHLIVVLKPQNVPTQEDESKDKDMLNMVKDYIIEKYQKPGNVFLGLVHRLDRPTGGVMVFAKTSKAASRLSEQIKNGDMSKKYLAVVDGVPKVQSGKLVNYLLKNEKTNTVNVVPQLTQGAKYAELAYKTLDSENGVSLVDIDLFTGRSHQIRVQFSSRNFPLYGDQKYNKKAIVSEQIALFAYSLSFYHPITLEKLTFSLDLPDRYPFTLFK